MVNIWFVRDMKLELRPRVGLANLMKEDVMPALLPLIFTASQLMLTRRKCHD